MTPQTLTSWKSRLSRWRVCRVSMNRWSRAIDSSKSSISSGESAVGCLGLAMWGSLVVGCLSIDIHIHALCATEAKRFLIPGDSLAFA
ncbi:hypothetical protein LHGZ1_2871 [Laribacter hongkongensis]|uniref:Uncharacterized protein n=1 Tax=Laribacter hongkongensis TaxID=168471 RepID=A0A248LM11_9NEIS|nr:hypothetical protein LHGZ1_2871 [Laribacter hongkongensis]